MVSQRGHNVKFGAWREHVAIMHGERGWNYTCGEWSGFNAQHPAQWPQVSTPDTTNDVYYNVFPLLRKPASRGRGKVKNVAGIGGLMSDFDGKDFLTEEEIEPHRVEPALSDSMTQKERREAVNAANGATKLAAVDALRPVWEERALQHIWRL